MCFDQFADVMLKGLHPGAWVHGYIAGFLLGLQSPELGRSYARYVQRLSAISDHPKPLLKWSSSEFDAAVFCVPIAPTSVEGKGQRSEKGGGFSDISLQSGRPLCEFYGAEMLRRMGPLGGVADTFTPRDVEQFGDVRDIQLVVSAIRKLVMRPAQLLAPHDTVGHDIRDRDFRAWICWWNGQYDEAARLLDDISEQDLARAYPANPEGVISFYDTRARLAQSDERRATEQVVETGTALIELLKAKYGLADHRTIDAQTDLEACLRKRDGDQADRVLHEINKGLDAVEERIKAMHLSS